MWSNAKPSSHPSQSPRHKSERDVEITRTPSMFDVIKASRAQVTRNQTFHNANLNPTKASIAVDHLGPTGPMHESEGSSEIFDSRLQLNFETFVKEAFYNLFWPLSLPLAVYLEGIEGVRTRSLWPTACDWGNAISMLVFNLPLAAGTWLPGIAFACGLCPNFGVTEVATTHLVTVLHRLCVATKYAYLNAAERRSLNNEVGRSSSKEMSSITNEIQLSGWSCQNRSTILRMFAGVRTRSPHIP